LADSYRSGEGVEKDLAKAFQLYRMAAETGHAEAQTRLADSYRNGEGVEKDLAKADQWYRIAAESVDDSAQVKPEVVNEVIPLVLN
jgi:TPR repeat protein